MMDRATFGCPPPPAVLAHRVPDVILRVRPDLRCDQVRVDGEVDDLDDGHDLESMLLESAMGALSKVVRTEPLEVRSSAPPADGVRSVCANLEELLSPLAARHAGAAVREALESNLPTRRFYTAVDDEEVREFQVHASPQAGFSLVVIRDITLPDPSGAVACALDQGGTSIRFRPRVRLGDRRHVVAETVPCWEHPFAELSPLDPSKVEGPIRDRVEDWMVHSAIRYAASSVARRHGFVVSVPVSERYGTRADIGQSITSLLECYAAPPGLLEFAVAPRRELDAKEYRAAIDRLRDVGSRTALREFGVAPLDLGELARLPVNAFIAPQPERLGVLSAHDGFVRGMQAIAAGLGVDLVVSEVVEADALEVLGRLGVKLVSGAVWGAAAEPPTFFRRARKSGSRTS
ncbi:MAG: EAL domain-containing protein [Myxococcota bacterium]